MTWTFSLRYKLLYSPTQSFGGETTYTAIAENREMVKITLHWILGRLL
jgi:hypothetical protein